MFAQQPVPQEYLNNILRSQKRGFQRNKEALVMILLVLAAIGATVFIFSCICLIVGHCHKKKSPKFHSRQETAEGRMGIRDSRLFSWLLIGMSRFILYWQGNRFPR